MNAHVISSAGASAPSAVASSQSAKDGFSELLGQVISGLETLQSRADRAAESVALGDLANLHQAMIAMQEASLALDLVVAVRNHVVEGIQELLRTQV
jgi:flagellar hook-basal body complex protein FliE